MDACLISWYSPWNLRTKNKLLISLLGHEKGDPWHTERRDTGASTKKADLFAKPHTSQRGAAIVVGLGWLRLYIAGLR